MSSPYLLGESRSLRWAHLSSPVAKGIHAFLAAAQLAGSPFCGVSPTQTPASLPKPCLEGITVQLLGRGRGCPAPGLMQAPLSFSPVRAQVCRGSRFSSFVMKGFLRRKKNENSPW